MATLADPPQTVLGVDITTHPSPRKPIWVATGSLRRNELNVHSLTPCPERADFLGVLQAPGPWIAGLDMPFGQPSEFVEAMGWGRRWEETVETVAKLGVEGYVQSVRAFQSPRPPGRKEPKRATDLQRPGAFSPIKVFRPAVGRMYASWAPALLQSGANILPCRPNGDPRTLVEVFPGSLARLLGVSRYKGAGEEQSFARRRLRSALQQASNTLGFRVSVQPSLDRLLDLDPEADLLDAVLACALAAWTSRHPEVPATVDSAEGWIFGP